MFICIYCLQKSAWVSCVHWNAVTTNPQSVERQFPYVRWNCQFYIPNSNHFLFYVCFPVLCPKLLLHFSPLDLHFLDTSIFLTFIFHFVLAVVKLQGQHWCLHQIVVFWILTGITNLKHMQQNNRIWCKHKCFCDHSQFIPYLWDQHSNERNFCKQFVWC